MYSQEMKARLDDRAERDYQLYARYGKPLEAEHVGEFIAVDSDGQVILGCDSDQVLRRAIDAFGSGNFALARVGKRALGEWLSCRQ